MRVRESRLRDALRIVVWKPGRWLVRVVPDRLALRAFEAAGNLHLLLKPARGRPIADRVAEVLPDADAAEAARRFVQNHYVDRLHILLYPRLTAARAGATLPSRPPWLGVEGRAHLDAALAEGRGVVIIHPHYALPQLLPLALGLEGVPCLQIGLPSDEGLSAVGRDVAFSARMELETLLPARIVPADGYLRPLYEWLHEGKVVLVTGDGTGGGRFQGRFAPMDLWGRRVLLPLGPARMALATGAVLLPGWVRRDGPARYVAVLDPPIPLPESGSRKERAEAATQRFADWMGERLRRDPGLWHFWEDFVPGVMVVDP